jgi:ribosomal protein S18 acetylase RimI-like enzyme
MRVVRYPVPRFGLALSADGYQHRATLPCADDFNALRQAVGWPPLCTRAVAAALGNSISAVSIYRKEELVGFGRTVGDGSLYTYLQDVAVRPPHQQKGLGRCIVSALQTDTEASVSRGAFIGFNATQASVGFYMRLGFNRLRQDELAFGVYV